MSKPEVSGIKIVAPKTDKFGLKDVNVFFVAGKNLTGARVTAMAGKVDKSNKLVTWSEIETLCNTDPEQILVKGLPEKAMIEGKETEGDDPGQRDPGSIAVTVTGAVTRQLPVHYEG